MYVYALKQFSKEVIKTCGFIFFKSRNRGFDFIMAGRRNLDAVIIDRVRNIIYKGGIGIVSITCGSATKFLFSSL